jgi:hypothetical protein
MLALYPLFFKFSRPIARQVVSFRQQPNGLDIHQYIGISSSFLFALQAHFFSLKFGHDKSRSKLHKKNLQALLPRQNLGACISGQKCPRNY